jgi:hypothetical protein
MLWLLALAGAAQAGMIESRDDPSDWTAGLAAPSSQHPDRGTNARCVSIDPTRPSGQSLPSSIDRPACTLPATPALGNREFLRVSHADVSMALGYVDGAQPGSGLIRLLTSFSHFLSSGPLAGWQFRADAQLGRPPTVGPDSAFDERVKLFLGAKPIAGWNLHFDATATNQGAFSLDAGAARSLEVAADISRIFIVPGWGQAHSLDIRFAEENTEDRVAGTSEESKRATLGYSHNLGFGSIGADFALIRFSPGDNTTHIDARSEIKFSRPF